MASVFSKSIASLLVVGAVLNFAGRQAFADQVVNFESAPVKPSPFLVRKTREQGEVIPQPKGMPLIAFLSRPQGNGPFPAIVVMHGCGGLNSRIKNTLSEKLVSWGYVVLVVDSFATRKIKSTCEDTVGDHVITGNDRVYDAYGALNFLSTYSFADAGRVALLGFSAGGVSTLEATKVEGDEQLMERKFKAAIAYYPTCTASEGDATVPTLILVGERDDWGRPERCRQRIAHLSGKGPPIQLDVYPGAFHDFDAPEIKTGRRYLGHWLEYNAPAAETANHAVQAFLQKFLAN